MSTVNSLYDDDEDVVIPSQNEDESSIFKNPDDGRPDSEEDLEWKKNSIDQPILNKNSGKVEYKNYSEETDFLKKTFMKKGIDLDAVKFEDEDGNEYEKSFDELTDDEKFTILNAEEDDLYEDEFEFLNTLRQNNISIDEFIQNVAEKAVADYRIQNENIGDEDFNIDSWTDEQIYLGDLKTKFPEWSDEKLLARLDKELEDPEAFVAIVEKLKEEYQTSIQQYKESQRQEKEYQKQVIQEEYIKTMVDVARNYDSIADMFTLDNDDKNEIIGFAVEDDGAGSTYLDRAMSDPRVKFEVSWFLTKGRDAFIELHNTFENVSKETNKRIKQAEKAAYEKGRKDALGQTFSEKPINKGIVHRETNDNLFKNNDKGSAVGNLYLDD